MLASIVWLLVTGARTNIEFLSHFVLKVVKWKLHEDSESVHHLFVKEHVVPIGETTKEKPPGKTLLCHNVPPYFSYVSI